MPISLPGACKEFFFPNNLSSQHFTSIFEMNRLVIGADSEFTPWVYLYALLFDELHRNIQSKCTGTRPPRVWRKALLSLVQTKTPIGTQVIDHSKNERKRHSTLVPRNSTWPTNAFTFPNTMRHDTAAKPKLTMRKKPSPMQNNSFMVALSRDISGCYYAGTSGSKSFMRCS